MKNQKALTAARKKPDVIDAYNGKTANDILIEVQKSYKKPKTGNNMPVETDATIKEKYGLHVTIEKHIEKIENGDTTIVVKYKNDDNLIKIKPSDREGLEKRLADYGCIYKDITCYKKIEKFITKKIMDEDYTYTYKNLGWDYCFNQKVIKLDKLITEQGPRKSKYIGVFELGRKGNEKDFIQGVKDYIVGKPGLEIALLLGICGLIAQELPNYDINIIVNYYGVNTNKTYFTKIPLVLFGDPDKLNMHTNKLSPKERRERIENQVIPAIIEEQQIPNNRGNMEKQYKVLKDTIANCCCPIILSTVESIAYKAASCNEGQIRIFEINCDSEESLISKDKDQLNGLKVSMRNNYGVAGEEFAQWMLKQGIYKDKLEDELYDWRIKLEKIFKSEDRMINSLAVIMLAGDLMNRCFGFGIDLDRIQRLFAKSVTRVVKGATTEEVHDKYIDKLIEYSNKNKDYFANNINMCFRDKHIGFLNVNNGYCELWVEPKAVRHILLGKDPKEYLDSLVGNKNKMEVKINGFNKIVKGWKIKGILQSGRESKGKRYNTSEITLFKNCKQRNIYIIRLGELMK